MNTSKYAVTIREREHAVLHALCSRFSAPARRVEFPPELESYAWQEPDHRVIYAALKKTHDRAGQPLREQLSAISTRMGFPDINWDDYFTSKATPEAELFETVRLLLAHGPR